MLLEGFNLTYDKLLASVMHKPAIGKIGMVCTVLRLYLLSINRDYSGKAAKY